MNHRRGHQPRPPAEACSISVDTHCPFASAAWPRSITMSSRPVVLVTGCRAPHQTSIMRSSWPRGSETSPCTTATRRPRDHSSAAPVPPPRRHRRPRRRARNCVACCPPCGPPSTAIDASGQPAPSSRTALCTDFDCAAMDIILARQHHPRWCAFARRRRRRGGRICSTGSGTGAGYLSYTHAVEGGAGGGDDARDNSHKPRCIFSVARPGLLPSGPERGQFAAHRT